MGATRVLAPRGNHTRSTTKQVGLHPTRASEDKDFATRPYILLNIWRQRGYNSSVSEPEPRSTCIPTRRKATLEEEAPVLH